MLKHFSRKGTTRENIRMSFSKIRRLGAIDNASLFCGASIGRDNFCVKMFLDFFSSRPTGIFLLKDLRSKIVSHIEAGAVFPLREDSNSERSEKGHLLDETVLYENRHLYEQYSLVTLWHFCGFRRPRIASFMLRCARAGHRG
jgi:hypothetical protein